MNRRDQLLDLISYDAETGVLRWKKTTQHTKAGAEVGTINSRGYRMIRVANKRELAHRAIWLMVHGRYPLVIDHINRNPSDNRLANLREATRSDNQHNRTRNGCAFYRTQSRKWQACVMVDRKTCHIGLYETEAEARRVARIIGKKVSEGVRPAPPTRQDILRMLQEIA